MTSEPPDVVALARRALALAGDAHVQVTASAGSARLHRFSHAGRGAETAAAPLALRVVAWQDGRTASVDAGGVADADLADAARSAVAAAREAVTEHGPGEHPGFADPRPMRDHDGYDPPTARHDPALGERIVAEAIAAADGPLDGLWHTSARETAIVSSSGLDLHDRTTAAALHLTLTHADGGHTSAAAQIASRAATLDTAALLARARETLLPGSPTTAAAGPLTLVLGPEAVAALLAHLGRAFDGHAIADGTSPLSRLLGRRVAASAINLADTPRFARGLRAAFDSEGTPKGPVALIQDGVAHRAVHDRLSAARAGTSPTGHAAADGPRPVHLVLSGGGAADLAELVAPVARGLYVGRLTYAADGAAVTGPGTVHVVDGRLAGPAAGVRLAADPLALLRATEELTMAQWAIPCEDVTAVVTPALRSSGGAVER